MGFEKYINEVRRLTKANKKELIYNWNGLDYYDNEYIKDNFNYHYNDLKYPTIDHKISILYGYKHNLSTEYISSMDNLCFTKRFLNCKKGKTNEDIFKLKLKQ